MSLKGDTTQISQVSRNSYPSWAKLLHWVMTITIIKARLVGLYTAHFRGDAPRGGLSLQIHESIASTVVFAIRVIYKASHRYPPVLVNDSGILVYIAKVVHFLLYVIAMAAVPLTGMYWTSVAGHQVPVLGLFHLPQIIGKDPAIYDYAMWAHRWMAWSAGVLVAGHVAAALGF